MYKLVIGDKEYELPNDLTLDKWVELNKWQAVPKKLVSIGMGIPMEDVNHIPADTMQLATSLVAAIMNPEWYKIKKEINGHQLIDFDSMSLGKFIDLEIYVLDYFKRMPDMVKVLYGMKDTDGIMLSDVYTAVQSYLKWRILLYKQYSNLFNADAIDEETIKDKHIKINAAHTWMDITMTLADGKFLNMDEVLNKPVIQAFNWLAWNKDRIRKENELQRHN